jgi:DnaA family protein
MMKQLTLDIAPAPQPAFGNFVAGNNVQVIAALRAALSGPPSERELCLWGEEGSGKTHLLKAGAAFAGESRAAYIACANAGFAPADFAGLDAGAQLAVDDVDQLDDAGQIALFNLINRRKAAGAHGALIVSCKKPPARTGLRADLASRLAQSLVLEVVALSDADKAAALAQHAQSRGIKLADDVTRYLLTRVKRDLPTLIAVLDALDRYSLEQQRPVTVPLLRDILQSQLDLGEPR